MTHLISPRPACVLSDANIHPETGLATDYLNRFNEAVMLLDMLGELPAIPRRFPRPGNR